MNGMPSDRLLAERAVVEVDADLVHGEARGGLARHGADEAHEADVGEGVAVALLGVGDGRRRVLVHGDCDEWGGGWGGVRSAVAPRMPMPALRHPSLSAESPSPRLPPHCQCPSPGLGARRSCLQPSQRPTRRPCCNRPASARR